MRRCFLSLMIVVCVGIPACCPYQARLKATATQLTAGLTTAQMEEAPTFALQTAQVRTATPTPPKVPSPTPTLTLSPAPSPTSTPIPSSVPTLMPSPAQPPTPTPEPVATQVPPTSSPVPPVGAGSPEDTARALWDGLFVARDFGRVKAVTCEAMHDDAYPYFRLVEVQFERYPCLSLRFETEYLNETMARVTAYYEQEGDLGSYTWTMVLRDGRWLWCEPDYL